MFVKIFQNSADKEMGEKNKQIHACMISMHTLEKHNYVLSCKHASSDLANQSTYTVSS